VLGTAAQVLATAKQVFDRDRLSVRLVQTLVAVALHDEMPLFDLAARLGGNVSTTHADLQHLGTINPRGQPGCGFITQRRNPIYPLQNVYELTPRGRRALSALVASMTAGGRCEA